MATEWVRIIRKSVCSTTGNLSFLIHPFNLKRMDVCSQNNTCNSKHVCASHTNLSSHHMSTNSDSRTRRRVSIITYPLKSHMLQIKGHTASNSLDNGLLSLSIVCKNSAIGPYLALLEFLIGMEGLWQFDSHFTSS